METVVGLSPYGTSVFGAAIRDGKGVRVRARGNGAKTARAEATDSLSGKGNIDQHIAPLHLRPPRHDDPDDDGCDDDGNDQSHQRVDVHAPASRTCCCLNSGFHPLTSASSAIQVCVISGPTTSPVRRSSFRCSYGSARPLATRRGRFLSFLGRERTNLLIRR